jgi:archaellum biogenesis ATPase FlaH
VKKKKMGEDVDIDEEEIRITSPYEQKNVLTSGNIEMDKKMGGGIPAGSLTIIEGPNDCGKSVVTQQIMWGGLQQGFTITSKGNRLGCRDSVFEIYH